MFSVRACRLINSDGRLLANFDGSLFSNFNHLPYIVAIVVLLLVTRIESPDFMLASRIGAVLASWRIRSKRSTTSAFSSNQSKVLDKNKFLFSLRTTKWNCTASVARPNTALLSC